MKVPIRYKSSDRYNAGVDVVYDDESKMQYAPFVYATTASGDNGGSEDEEGEDSMVVNVNAVPSGYSLDKTWQEIYDAVADGKCVYLRQAQESDDDGVINYSLWSVSYVGVDHTLDPNPYIVIRKEVNEEDGALYLDIKTFSADTPTGTPVYSGV